MLFSASHQRLIPDPETRFSDCRDLCSNLGSRCDALDIDGAPPQDGNDPVLPWCGVWGMRVLPADAVNGFVYFCDGGCLNGTGGPVCRGDLKQKSNTCFLRPPLCNTTL